MIVFFVPALVMGDIAGLEVIRPAVAVLLGGVITSTLMTLLVLPPLYLALAPAGLPPDDDDPEDANVSRADVDARPEERLVR